MHPVAHNKGKEPIVPNDVDAPAYDELSSGSSLSLGLLPVRNKRAKLGKRPSHRPAFSHIVSGAFRRARREAGEGQSQLDRILNNASVWPAGTIPPTSLVHPTFYIGSTFYMPLAALIRGLDNMLSSPLGQYILDYEPPRRFFIPALATFVGSTDSYDHMLYYNQAIILNTSNDRLLCKVFPTSLRGPALEWFHKIPRNSLTTFNELWAAFVSQYLCLVLQKRNIGSL